MKIELLFFLLILYFCKYQSDTILGCACTSMCALVCKYVVYVQVCVYRKDVLSVSSSTLFLIMPLKTSFE